MKLFRIINKFFSFLYYLLKYQSYSTAYLFAFYQVSYYDAAVVKRKGKELLFQNSGNTLPIRQLPIYKLALTTLIKVLNDNRSKILKVNDGKGFEMSFNDLRFVVQSLPNIITVYEVFIEKLYNIIIPEQNTVLLDIGMNVGYASLFFASLEQVGHVYSYEPFPETFKEANKNIDFNSSVKNKITSNNYGISNYSGNLEVPFFESGSSMASTNKEILDEINLKQSSTLSVCLVNITNVLEEVFSKHPDQNIILKIDCEGEEYGIMEMLDKTGQLKKIKALFIEWHFKGSVPIIKTLKANNFITLDLARTDVASGMLYAFNY